MSKIKYSFIVLIFFIFISCQKQECICGNFKTGKFEFNQEIDGKKLTTTFERTNLLQIETFNGRIDTATVRWINDCEFILQKIHPRKMAEKKAISMKILSTKDKTYFFEYSFVGEAKKQTGTVTKIN